MKGWFIALALAVSGCGPDCHPSADIEVTIVSNAEIDVQGIARLRVALSIDGGPTQALDITPPGPLTASAAFILRPDPAPAATYAVSITIEALRSDGQLLGLGSTSGQVVANGCNRLEARLTPLPGGVDGGVNLGDAGLGSDLAGCLTLNPDEDDDGRADFCDLCPADSDNGANSDVDGLPDACDPDPTVSGNAAIYTDLFNSASGQWSGGFSVGSGYLKMLVPMGAQVAANGINALPPDVRVQAWLNVQSFFDPDATGTTSSAGVYLGTSTTPSASTASGMLCTVDLNQVSMQLEVRLTPITAGQFGVPTVAPHNAEFPNRKHRVRLTQRGSSYACEVVTGTMGRPPLEVTATGPLAGSAQFMAIYGQEVDMDVNSVFATSVLP